MQLCIFKVDKNINQGYSQEWDYSHAVSSLIPALQAHAIFGCMKNVEGLEPFLTCGWKGCRCTGAQNSKKN